MRLYNEIEQKTKIVPAEDYSKFRELLKNKLLPILLYVYTGYVVVHAALTVLSGAYILAGIDLIIHALICVSLWMFRAEQKKNEELVDKGTKMFQISHAVKYVIMFVLLIVLLLLTILKWSDDAGAAKIVLTAAKSQTEASVLAEAKAQSRQVFWNGLFSVIKVIVTFIIVCVYYRGIMGICDGYQKYVKKGTHFWGEFKFFAIYGFVCAGVLIVYGAISAFTSFSVISITTNAVNLFVSTGLFGFINYALFACLLVFAGIVSLKLYKELANSETMYYNLVDNETGEVIRVATEEDIEEARKFEEQLKQLAEEEEKEQENFVSSQLLYDEATTKNIDNKDNK